MLTSVVVTLEDERKRKVGFLNPDVMVVVYSYLDNIINSKFPILRICDRLATSYFSENHFHHSILQTNNINNNVKMHNYPLNNDNIKP